MFTTKNRPFHSQQKSCIVLIPIGYMMLYLSVLQMLAYFSAHLLMTRIASGILVILSMLATASVGGYMIHIGEIPPYLYWSESFSPQRWLLPVIIADEFSQETLANTAGQQLCRNKHVSWLQSNFLLRFTQSNYT